MKMNCEMRANQWEFEVCGIINDAKTVISVSLDPTLKCDAILTNLLQKLIINRDAYKFGIFAPITDSQNLEKYKQETKVRS